MHIRRIISSETRTASQIRWPLREVQWPRLYRLHFFFISIIIYNVVMGHSAVNKNCINFPIKILDYFYARVVILVAFGRKRRLGMFDL